MDLLLSSGKNNPPQKYLDHRSEIKNGDIILYKGSSFMSKAIQYFDKAYYNHIGVAWIPENSGRILTLDMWSAGLDCIPLSRRMSGYDDFCIMRPKVSTLASIEAIKTSLGMWDGREIKYDFGMLLRVVFSKKFGIDIRSSKKNRFICSEFAQYYVHLLDIHTYDDIDMITPQDFMRGKDSNFEVFLDDSK
jgi:hypothetical protein